MKASRGNKFLWAELSPTPKSYVEAITLGTSESGCISEMGPLQR